MKIEKGTNSVWSSGGSQGKYKECDINYWEQFNGISYSHLIISKIQKLVHIGCFHQYQVFPYQRAALLFQWTNFNQGFPICKFTDFPFRNHTIKVGTSSFHPNGSH